MKRLRRLLSLLIVGVIAVTSLFCGTVTASAANSKASLLSLDITKIDSKAKYINSLGQDLYMLSNDTYRAVYKIGSDEIKNWRKTGKLKATKITIDSEIAKLTWDCYTDITFDYGNYAEWYYTDRENKTTKYIVKYDKTNKKITKVYSTDNYIGVSSDGSMSEFIWDEDKRKLTLKILNNKAKLVKTLNFDYSDGYGDWWCFAYGSKYACVFYPDKHDDIGFDVIHTLIDAKGNTKKVETYNVSGFQFDLFGNNYQAFELLPRCGIAGVYLTDSGKDYSIINTDLHSYTAKGKYFYLCGLGIKIYGTKAIGEYVYNEKGNYFDFSDQTNEYKYALIDVKTSKFISKKYDGMYTSDNGNTFLVKNSKGQWGYINAKGKELAMFTNASEFYVSGKYAPVIKDGYIYLINKSMKQVSKTIKADKDSEVYTLSAELFEYTKGGKTYLMTNK